MNNSRMQNLSCPKWIFWAHFLGGPIFWGHRLQGPGPYRLQGPGPWARKSSGPEISGPIFKNP